jgi:hypothetical protein
MQICAVAPALHDEFTCEPIFTRAALGRPLEWTGVLPDALMERVDRVLADGMTMRGLVERRRAVPA